MRERGKDKKEESMGREKVKSKKYEALKWRERKWVEKKWTEGKEDTGWNLDEIWMEQMRGRGK